MFGYIQKQPANEVIFNLHLRMREMEELRAWTESDDISVKNNNFAYLPEDNCWNNYAIMSPSVQYLEISENRRFQSEIYHPLTFKLLCMFIIVPYQICEYWKYPLFVNFRPLTRLFDFFLRSIK